MGGSGWKCEEQVENHKTEQYRYEPTKRNVLEVNSVQWGEGNQWKSQFVSPEFIEQQQCHWVIDEIAQESSLAKKGSRKQFCRNSKNDHHWTGIILLLFIFK